MATTTQEKERLHQLRSVPGILLMAEFFLLSLLFQRELSRLRRFSRQVKNLEKQCMMWSMVNMLKSVSNAKAIYLVGTCLLLGLVFFAGSEIGATLHDVFHHDHA